LASFVSFSIPFCGNELWHPIQEAFEFKWQFLSRRSRTDRAKHGKA
jgi:hypothetical protein